MRAFVLVGALVACFGLFSGTAEASHPYVAQERLEVQSLHLRQQAEQAQYRHQLQRAGYGALQVDLMMRDLNRRHQLQCDQLNRSQLLRQQQYELYRRQLHNQLYHGNLNHGHHGHHNHGHYNRGHYHRNHHHGHYHHGHNRRSPYLYFGPGGFSFGF